MQIFNQFNKTSVNRGQQDRRKQQDWNKTSDGCGRCTVFLEKITSLLRNVYLESEPLTSRKDYF